VLVHQGDTVRAGQTIAVLSQPGAPEDVQAAEARVAGARAAIETLKAGGRSSDRAAIDADVSRLKGQRAVSEVNLMSLEHLLKANAATPYEVDQARAALKDLDTQIQGLETRRGAMVGSGDMDAAQARLNEAEASLKLARTHEGQSAIVTTIAGVVYDLPARTGAYLHPGDAVASVGKLDPVRVRVYVDEPELGRIDPGEKVRITWDALTGREWTGTVTRKPLEVVALGSRQVGEVLCTIDNPGRDLTPGANVNAFIVSKTVEGAVSIPKTALRQDNGTGVFTLAGDGTVKWRAVKTGISDTMRVEVTGGLSDGDRVAMPGDRVLKDGMAVKAAGQE
jgi:multidrug efflux pump subunit AcrA (membrane-fusion protein)